MDTTTIEYHICAFIAIIIALFPVILMMALAYIFPWYDETANTLEGALLLIEAPWFILLIKKNII
jgi:hypothetical protein